MKYKIHIKLPPKKMPKIRTQRSLCQADRAGTACNFELGLPLRAGILNDLKGLCHGFLASF